MRLPTPRHLIVGLLAFLPIAAAARDMIELSERGQARRFEVAADEVYTISADRSRRLERVPAQPDRAGLAAESRRLQRARAGEARLVLYEADRPRSAFTRRLVTPRVFVQLDGWAPATKMGLAVGATRLQKAPGVAGGWMFEAPDSAAALDMVSALRGQPGVLRVEPQLARQQQARSAPADPFFTNQWHLLNRGQSNGYATVDIDVTNVWDSYRGEGMVIGIVDDGLQVNHPDLTNADTSIDYDYVDADADPSPGVDDNHGTACGGVAAGIGSNNLGVVGAAYRAALVGLRLISAPSTDEEEAAAMSHSNQLIHVKSNSWGPVDDGQTLEGPGLLTEAALRDGVRNGRGGRGIVYTWAGGNGLESQDNANKDGYANSIYTIAFAAINDQGMQSFYSEPGSCLVVSTPSSDASPRQGITTTDRTGSSEGYNTNAADYANRDYTMHFGGTSSSSPLGAGAIALILQANTNLGWRDVQEILIRTAFKNHATDTGWRTNRAGFVFNHKYGAGLLKTRAAVAMALTWTNLGTQTSISAERTNFTAAIPDNNSGGTNIVFSFSNVNLRVEHVVVTLDMDHTYRGDLEVILTAPSGMQSQLMTTNEYDWNNDFHYWRFMSVRHWGESSTGTWSVKVADRVASDVGTLRYARIEIFGTAATNSPPYLISPTNWIDDTADGNGNGMLDPGETILHTVALLNLAGPATGVTASLSTTSPIPVFIQSSVDYPDAATQDTVTNTPSFRYRLPKTAACGSVLTFRQDTYAQGRVFTSYFSRVVGAPVAGPAITTTNISSSTPRSITNGVAIYLTNTINLAGQPVIDDVNVSLRINHSFAGDLDIALWHPDGTEVVLANNDGLAANFGGGGTNCGTATYTVFDDGAASSIVDGTAPFVGSFRPQRQLSTLNGKLANGVWKLKIADEYPPDVGTALCWRLTIVTHTNGSSCAPFNHAPIASNLTLQATPVTATNLALAGSDADGEILTFGTNDTPAFGDLSGLDTNSGLLAYAPRPGQCGTDTFTFVAFDGYATSAPGVVTVLVDCNADTDGDGMADVWESSWFTNLATVGAGTDFDGDLFGDESEYRAGTDPVSATSYLAVAAFDVQDVEPAHILQWPSVSNRLYSIFAGSNLLAGYTGVVTNLPATPPLNVYTDPAPADVELRVYQLRVE